MSVRVPDSSGAHVAFCFDEKPHGFRVLSKQHWRYHDNEEEKQHDTGGVNARDHSVITGARFIKTGNLSASLTGVSSWPSHSSFSCTEMSL